MKIRVLYKTFLLTMAFLLSASPAWSNLFGDTAVYFPGHANNSGEDDKDVIGVPDIHGGSVSFSGSYLSGVNIAYSADNYQNTYNQHLLPGDLFLDMDASGDWDYFIIPDARSLGQSTWSIYEAVGNWNYVSTPLKKTDGTTWNTSKYNVRDDHPWAVAWSEGNTPEAVGTALFSGMPYGLNQQASWLIMGNFIEKDQLSSMVLGFTQNCANDVLHEQIDSFTPQSQVPLPASVWLLGSALMGMVGLRKRVMAR